MKRGIRVTLRLWLEHLRRWRLSCLFTWEEGVREMERNQEFFPRCVRFISDSGEMNGLLEISHMSAFPSLGLCLLLRE